MDYGLYANRPTSAEEGTQYQPTDNPFFYVWSGGAWKTRMPGSPMEHNPGLSSFQTWVNQDSAAIDTTTGIVKLACLQGQANSTERYHLRVDALSGGGNSAFTMTLGYQLGRGAGATVPGGIILRNSANGRFMIYGVTVTTGAPRLFMSQYSSPTAVFSSGVFTDYWGLAFDRDVYLRLVADATNFSFYYSMDAGGTWQLHRQRAISGDYLGTYDQIGYGINNAAQVASTQDAGMNILHAVQN